MSRLGWLLLLIWLGPLFQAEALPSPRRQIEAAYAKSARATRLRFLEGALSHRTLDYVALDTRGQTMDMGLERSRLERFFHQALTLEESFQVLDYQARETGRVQVLVRQELLMSVVDPATRKPLWILLETRSQDQWQHSSSGWRLQRSRLEHQQARVTANLKELREGS